MAGIKDYSPVPASNTDLFPEGMAPSAVNDGMRQVQADIRAWYDDAEWIDPGYAVSYAGATSFAVEGVDVTDEYHAGRRVKITGTTGTVYGTITSSVFGTDTTVELMLDGGALENQALAVYLGILRAEGISLPATAVATGEIRMYGGSSAPPGWKLCDGSAISRMTFAALFAVIGTTYGAGDGSTTFNVPDLRGRAPIGAGDGGAGLTNRALGQKGGAETHTLTEAEMPAHSHSGTANSSGSHVHRVHGTDQGGTGNAFERSSGSSDTNVGNDTNPGGAHTHSLSINTTGSGSAHNNMQPFAVVNFIIKT